MIEFWKDNNVGLPERADLLKVNTDTITLMKLLLEKGFEEVCNGRSLHQRTFFLVDARRVITCLDGYLLYQTLCFQGIKRGT